LKNFQEKFESCSYCIVVSGVAFFCTHYRWTVADAEIGQLIDGYYLPSTSTM